MLPWLKPAPREKEIKIHVICFVIRMRFWLFGSWFGFPASLLFWALHPHCTWLYEVITSSSVQNPTEQLLASQTEQH